MYFKNDSYSPPLTGSQRGFISSLHFENLVESLEVKQVWGYLYGWIPLEFLTLKIVHTVPLAIKSITVEVFLLQHCFIQGFLLVSFCSGEFWFSESACLSLQFWGQWFDLWPHFPDRSKTCWFFSLLSFLLPISLHVGLEAGVKIFKNGLFHLWKMWE